MAEFIISQSEADVLIAMEKFRINDEKHSYPGIGDALSIPLISKDKKENFILDIQRGKIDFLKGKYQNRARQIIVLVRLDFGGQPHRNPDGEEIASPHLHIYREGYGDKYAMPIPIGKFPNISDLWGTLQDFMRFCNIIEPPFIERGLFV